MDQRLGVMICWNTPTFGEEDFATPNVDPDIFAPTGMDVDQWLDAVAASPSKYAILTCTHQDGFALWPTNTYAPGYMPYSVAQTAWYRNNGQPDVVKLFCDGCRERGINPVLYLNMVDTTFVARCGGVVDTVLYLQMIKDRITELLTWYGEITALWLDTWITTEVVNYVPVADIYFLIKRLQPNCLMLTNATTGPNYNSQIDIYDGVTPSDDNTRLAEWAQTDYATAPYWFWHSGIAGATLKDPAAMNVWLEWCKTRNITIAMGIQPTTAGVIPANVVSFLAQLEVT